MRLYFWGMFFSDAGTVGANVSASISRMLSASLKKDVSDDWMISNLGHTIGAPGRAFAIAQTRSPLSLRPSTCQNYRAGP